MTTMIVLTEAQADAVRGVTTPGHVLCPILLADGVTFVLPVDVLMDAAHEAKWDELSALPKRDVADSELVQPGVVTDGD